MELRHGFKKEANTIASDVRKDLGLRALDRFDPFVLADDLGIEVIPLSGLVRDHPDIAHLLTKEQEVFSAVTVFCDARRSIVHNDAHAWVRQKSNVAHELAHGLLLHPPTPALDSSGCRLWNQSVEDEAAWLGSVLLVSEFAAVTSVRRGLSVEEAAAALDVSVQMMQMRVNTTGAVRRAMRIREKSNR